MENTLTSKYEIEITPQFDIPTKTDWGFYKTLEEDRILFKDLTYSVCNLQSDEINTYFEMWDEQGFIGNYSILNTDVSKCIINKLKKSTELVEKEKKN